MKVCKKHLSVLERGMTYTIVNEEECELCKLLKKYGGTW